MNGARYFMVALVTLLLALMQSFAAYAAKLPNVLLIMADDHASYVCGAYGNKQARTPNIDRLACTGVTFTEAFVNCPMCTASRQSLLTGRMPHSIEVTQLTTALSDETTTLAEVLVEMGYDTTAIGKMHFNSGLTHGFDKLIDHKDHRAFLKEHPARKVPYEIAVLPQWKPFKDHARIWLNGMYHPYGAYDNDMEGTFFAQQGQQYLRDHADSEDPFFLIVSFYEPHSPFRFPIEYSGSFDPNDFSVQPIGAEDDWQIPEIFRNLTDEEKCNITAAYYTSTEYMDHNVGRVLDSLDESGLSGETLVIYLGDHGYSLGHHGRFEKHTHFEESVSAPLIMRLPNAERYNVKADGLVEFIDIFPTITEFCGADNPKEIDGFSLMPLLKGEQNKIRDSVFCEYYENEEAMIRTDKYKFIFGTGKRLRQDGYQTGKPLPGMTKLLYDIEKDPAEMTNLASHLTHKKLILEFEMEMLERLEPTHPAAKDIPPGLNIEQKLEYYLTWREEGKKK